VIKTLRSVITALVGDTTRVVALAATVSILNGAPSWRLDSTMLVLPYLHYTEMTDKHSESCQFVVPSVRVTSSAKYSPFILLYWQSMSRYEKAHRRVFMRFVRREV
jgi:hypothetical protein